MRTGLKTARRLAGAVGKAAVEAIFPAKCLACGEIIGRHEEIRALHNTGAQVGGDWLVQQLAAYACPGCLAGIQPVSSPICESCGRVFASRAGPNRICESCIRTPNHFHQARSALIYTDPCARLVHAFKYRGKIQLARPLGTILSMAFNRFWPVDEFDLIIPVPLHRRKLKQRGFNQVLLMMRQWALLDRQPAGPATGRTFDWEVLERVLPTRPQTGLGRRDRPANLRNAFGLADKRAVAGLKVLVVDDVYTTGATANECARQLRRHGAELVDVLTLARAV
jgi:ComF family protein